MCSKQGARSRGIHRMSCQVFMTCRARWNRNVMLHAQNAVRSEPSPSSESSSSDSSSEHRHGCHQSGMRVDWNHLELDRWKRNNQVRYACRQSNPKSRDRVKSTWRKQAADFDPRRMNTNCGPPRTNTNWIVTAAIGVIDVGSVVSRVAPLGATSP